MEVVVNIQPPVRILKAAFSAPIRRPQFEARLARPRFQLQRPRRVRGCRTLEPA